MLMKNMATNVVSTRNGVKTFVTFVMGGVSKENASSRIWSELFSRGGCEIWVTSTTKSFEKVIIKGFDNNFSKGDWP